MSRGVNGFVVERSLICFYIDKITEQKITIKYVNDSVVEKKLDTFCF